jgi:hypothetical protein
VDKSATGSVNFLWTMTPAAFRAAVDAYRLTATVPPHPDGSIIIGHGHGLRAAWEPALFYALARETEAAALAFEWSYDELQPLIDGLLATGRLDVDELWRLPEDAEAFCGDGRITAGHVALLEALLAERRLAQVILFDRLDSEPPARSEEMALRLSEAWDRRHRLVAVVGAAHLPKFRAHLPEVAVLELDYEGAVTGTAVVPER